LAKGFFQADRSSGHQWCLLMLRLVRYSRRMGPRRSSRWTGFFARPEAVGWGKQARSIGGPGRIMVGSRELNRHSSAPLGGRGGTVDFALVRAGCCQVHLENCRPFFQKRHGFGRGVWKRVLGERDLGNGSSLNSGPNALGEGPWEVDQQSQQRQATMRPD